MAFNLFGTPKRRSRSSGGGGGKMLDTALGIGVLGIIGVGGYFLLKNSKSLEDMLKSTVDAGNSLGDYIADGSYWFQNLLGIGNTPGGRGEEDNIRDKIANPVRKEIENTRKDQDVLKKKYAATWGPLANAVDNTSEALGNAGCRFQKLFNPSLSCR